MFIQFPGEVCVTAIESEKNYFWKLMIVFACGRNNNYTYASFLLLDYKSF